MTYKIVDVANMMFKDWPQMSSCGYFIWFYWHLLMEIHWYFINRSPTNCGALGTKCATSCAYGRAAIGWSGSIGCDSCDCNPPPVKPEQPCVNVTCAMYCEYGMVHVPGEDCPRCECNPVPHYCSKMECKDGDICRMVYTDIMCDCPEYGPCNCPDPYEPQCVPESPGNCPDISFCNKHCQYGLMVDSWGCSSCHCNTSPYPKTPALYCPKPVCQEDCEFGYETARDGCATCTCRKTPTLFETGCGIVCGKECEHGNVLDDETGCKTCDCLPAPAATHIYIIIAAAGAVLLVLTAVVVAFRCKIRSQQRRSDTASNGKQATKYSHVPVVTVQNDKSKA